MYRTSDALVFTVLVLRTLKLIVKKKNNTQLRYHTYGFRK